MEIQKDPSGPEATDQNQQTPITQRLCLKIAEAAKVIGVDPVTVRRMINRGLLKPFRGLRTPLIPVKQIKDLIENSTEPTQTPKSKKLKDQFSKNCAIKQRARKGDKSSSSDGKEGR